MYSGTGSATLPRAASARVKEGPTLEQALLLVHLVMSKNEIEILLSARSSTAITLAEVGGEQVVTALGGVDAAAHLRVGDIVLSVNGRSPGRTPSCWREEDAGGDSATVLTLRVRRPQIGQPSTAAGTSAAPAAGDSGYVYAYGASFGGYGLSEGMYSLPANLIPLPDSTLVRRSCNEIHAPILLFFCWPAGRRCCCTPLLLEEAADARCC